MSIGAFEGDQASIELTGRTAISGREESGRALQIKHPLCVQVK